MTKESLNGLTIKATYKYDYYTHYGFQCGKCGYDAGSKLTVPMEECPKCNPQIKPSEISLLDEAIKIAILRVPVGDTQYGFIANPDAMAESVGNAIRPYLRTTEPVVGGDGNKD